MSEIRNNEEYNANHIEDTIKDKYLVFKVDGQSYATAMENVIEIIYLQTITFVPHVAHYIRGITNMRGKVIPIIDVRLRFGKEPAPYNDRTCVIVIEVEEYMVGLIIDSVSETLTIPESEITPPSVFSDNVTNRYVSGIGKAEDDLQLILDCKKLLIERDEFQFSELEAEA